VGQQLPSSSLMLFHIHISKSAQEIESNSNKYNTR
jgi:hypothetical protein